MDDPPETPPLFDQLNFKATKEGRLLHGFQNNFPVIEFKVRKQSGFMLSDDGDRVWDEALGDYRDATQEESLHIRASWIDIMGPELADLCDIKPDSPRSANR